MFSHFSSGLHRIGAQHLQVGIDAVDHSEGFSIDLDQCSCFMREFVTPSTEQSFGELGFLIAMRKSVTVSLLTNPCLRSDMG